MRATRSAAELLVGSASAGSLLLRPTSAGRCSTPGGAGLRRGERARTAFETSGLTKHEFGHAHGVEHGLLWEDTIVTGVFGQAQKKGVRTGWKIYMVDGHVVTCSEDIWRRIQEAKWQWRSCYIWFVTDKAAIRAEAARTRAAKIQAEAERLARLPFENALDTRHVEQVKEEFKFQAFIEGPEHRAISLVQLRHLLGWAGDHCHRWRDPVTRQKLHADIMNLYQVNHWLIKPATREKDCSFVELLARERQPPAWFVIHWWGEKAADLLRCLELQASLRRLTEHAGFWIGAYANRQHSLQDEISDDPRRNLYFRAMSLAQFRVLLTLDARTENTNPGNVFSRAWCDLEGIMCLDEPSVVLDIATVQNSKAIVLTKGLTEEEQESEKRSPGAGYKAKDQRERAFGTDALASGLSVSVQHAQATEPGDRGRVLNCIAGRDPGLQPLEESDQYNKANRRLRALYALTCWRRVVGSADDNLKDLQMKLTDALRNDTWRESLDLSLAYCPGGVEKMALLMRSLPSTLKELTINLSGMNLADEHIVAFASGLPAGLEELNLNLSGNSDISNVGIANFMQNAPPKLRSQSLELAATGVSKEFKDKGMTMDGIKQAIYDESQTGHLCTTVNLVPSATRRMTYIVERSKCY